MLRLHWLCMLGHILIPFCRCRNWFSEWLSHTAYHKCSRYFVYNFLPISGQLKHSCIHKSLFSNYSWYIIFSSCDTWYFINFLWNVNLIWYQTGSKANYFSLCISEESWSYQINPTSFIVLQQVGYIVCFKFPVS